jgi:hypothetical protein
VKIAQTHQALRVVLGECDGKALKAISQVEGVAKVLPLVAD